MKIILARVTIFPTTTTKEPNELIEFLERVDAMTTRLGERDSHPPDESIETLHYEEEQETT